MARQFQVNWQFIVEEAKERRKKQKLTQNKLAKLADVSTPTISRFESGEENIALFTILKILRILGMVDNRKLEFSKKRERYDFEREIIEFYGVDNCKNIKCVVSKKLLEDNFGRSDNLLKTFQKNRKIIEREAYKKYIRNFIEFDGSILIKAEDL